MSEPNCKFVWCKTKTMRWNMIPHSAKKNCIVGDNSLVRLSVWEKPVTLYIVIWSFGIIEILMDNEIMDKSSLQIVSSWNQITNVWIGLIYSLTSKDVAHSNTITLAKYIFTISKYIFTVWLVNSPYVYKLHNMKYKILWQVEICWRLCTLCPVVN